MPDRRPSPAPAHTGPWAILSLGTLWLFSSPALADVVFLKNGGELRGTFVGQRTPNGPVTIQTLAGSEITLAPDSIDSTQRRSPEAEEYVTRSREIPDTVEAHLDLAEWCRDHRLTAQREEQYEAVIRLDRDHVAARRGLDHHHYQGEWMTRDEMMTAQGYVKYKGKYLTRQEIALAENTSQQRKSEAAWFPKIRMWRTWATGNDAGRQLDGRLEIRKITDPDAIPALQELLSDIPDRNLRLLYIERLTAIPGPQSVPPLVKTSLLDVDEGLRSLAFQGLGAERHADSIPYYVEALGSPFNVAVNRSAVILAEIGDWRVVPPLIKALKTRHRVIFEEVVSVPTTTMTRSPNGRYSVGGSQGPLLPPHIELLLRTGQLPNGVTFVQPGQPLTRRVTRQVIVGNPQVLAALQTLTEKDFGFDQEAWQIYWDAYRTGKGALPAEG